MVRKILSWTFIIVGSIFLILSVAGIAATWIYKGPLTDRTETQLKQVDTELTQAHTALDNGKTELQRTLRIVEAAEKGLAALKSQMSTAKTLTDQLKGTMNNKLLPGLQTTRAKIAQLRSMLQNLRDTLAKVNSIPFLNLNIPGDQFLAGIIGDVDSLDKEIVSAQQLAEQASTFVGDTSYLMGGDLSDTKVRIEKLLDTVTEYDQKVAGWQAQVEMLIARVPGWFQEAALGITAFLLWFGISQFGLIVHGLSLRRGEDPFAVIRRSAFSD